MNRITELKNRIGIMRDALGAAAYVCEGVAQAPARPETVDPEYARRVARECRRAAEAGEADETLHGTIQTPDKAAYTYHWDETRQQLIVALTGRDPAEHDGGMLVQPRSGNAIGLSPRSRKAGES